MKHSTTAAPSINAGSARVPGHDPVNTVIDRIRGQEFKPSKRPQTGVNVADWNQAAMVRLSDASRIDGTKKRAPQAGL
jgi:hypothetical protein